jgi:hypothetical protein
MIIDADTHINGRGTGAGVSMDESLRQMDALGVEAAICWPMVSYEREMALDNKAIALGARQHPDRVLNFGGVNPLTGFEAAKEELKRCIGEYGVKGVKLNGARDGYYIDDPKLSLPLVDMIAEAGIALAFHCGANDFEKTHPFRIAKISEMYPDMPIVVVHMGGSGYPNMCDAVIEYAAQYPNWYLVDSEADYRSVLKALQVLGPDRLCYGSDSPFCPMRFEWGLRHVTYQDLSAADQAKVFGGNIARALGL